MQAHDIYNETTSIRERLTNLNPYPFAIKPTLTHKALDGLLTFIEVWSADYSHMQFDAELYGQTGWEDYIRTIPRQITNDMFSGIEYLEKLIIYNLANGTLTLKSDLTLREIQYEKPVKDYLASVESWPRTSSGKPIPPRMTRKRANGLWWVLAISSNIRLNGWDAELDLAEYTQRLMNIDSEEFELRYKNGESLVSNLARYHESRFPTAPRTA